MARRKKRSKATWKTHLDKIDKRIIFTLLLLVGLTVGVTAGPWSTFGESSDWGADVEILGFGYNGNIYTDVNQLPATSELLLSGTRTITVDYDGKVDCVAQPEKTIGLWTFNDIPTGTVGMLPRVTHSVGNFFFTNELGEKSLAPIRKFENTSINLGNIHYYFGFSVMFTTRAELQYHGSVLWYNRDSGEYNWAGKQLAPIQGIDLSTIVGINVASLTGTFEYEGFINEVKVINQRARYTIDEGITGVSSDLDAFNINYDWNALNMKGAVNEKVPLITYNVIDSTEEKMASIELGAYLEIGVDATDIISGAIVQWKDTYNPSLNLEGYTFIAETNVYNVELIYDVMVDLSINGVPIADAMGKWAEGTNDGTFPVDDPEEFNWIYIAIVALVAVIIVTALMGRR